MPLWRPYASVQNEIREERNPYRHLIEEPMKKNLSADVPAPIAPVQLPLPLPDHLANTLMHNGQHFPIGYQPLVSTRKEDDEWVAELNTLRILNCRLNEIIKDKDEQIARYEKIMDTYSALQVKTSPVSLAEHILSPTMSEMQLTLFNQTHITAQCTPFNCNCFEEKLSLDNETQNDRRNITGSHRKKIQKARKFSRFAEERYRELHAEQGVDNLEDPIISNSQNYKKKKRDNFFGIQGKAMGLNQLCGSSPLHQNDPKKSFIDNDDDDGIKHTELMLPGIELSNNLGVSTSESIHKQILEFTKILVNTPLQMTHLELKVNNVEAAANLGITHNQVAGLNEVIKQKLAQYGKKDKVYNRSE